jgi:nitrogen-specific signal transduction histidine kinase/CheY-like chemotaxis protein
VAIAGLGRDLSAWEELEEQYRQSQKMEAIGRLAGGIAHDFNNLLTVINGYSSLALSRLDERHEARPALTEIQKAGDRAATLTRQLLAFSRKQLFRLRVLNVNDVVSDALDMLSRLIGAHIRIDCELESNPWMVRADPGQMMQVLLNLAVNSRDAITGSGRIVLQTANHLVPPEGDSHFPTLSPGNFVELRVADDGSGMSEETQRHLFEPFFTTKPPGEGTGLGLATVYGIVRQSGGAIHVRSRQGEGTLVRVLLPAVSGSAEPIRESAPVPPATTDALILLVEDQEAVRDFLRTVLEESGFRVVTAADGAAALDLLRGGCRPDILLTDIVMPGLGGPAIAAQARDLIPGLRVVFVSGYAPSRERTECDAYLQKPFTGDALITTLRSLLPRSDR